MNFNGQKNIKNISNNVTIASSVSPHSFAYSYFALYSSFHHINASNVPITKYEIIIYPILITIESRLPLPTTTVNGFC